MEKLSLASPRPPRRTATISYFFSAAAWSPNGKELAYGSSTGPRCPCIHARHVEGVWTINADGSDGRLIYKTIPLLNGSVVNAPLWSPDGSQFAFSSYRRHLRRQRGRIPPSSHRPRAVAGIRLAAESLDPLGARIRQSLPPPDRHNREPPTMPPRATSAWLPLRAHRGTLIGCGGDSSCGLTAAGSPPRESGSETAARGHRQPRWRRQHKYRASTKAGVCPLCVSDVLLANFESEASSVRRP